MKWFLAGILFFSLSSVFAQSKKLEKADELYNAQNFSEALELFLTFEGKVTDPQQLGELKSKMAHCYYMLHMPGLAIDNYEKAMLFDVELSAESTINYARCLIQTGNYSAAKQILVNIDAGMYIEQILLDKCDFALENNQASAAVKLYSLNELPANPGYGISYYRDNLLYIFSYEQQKNNSNAGIFGYLGRNDKTVTSLAEIDFPENVNSPVIYGSNTMYFCANATYQKNLIGGKERDYIGVGGVDNLYIYFWDLSEEKSRAKALPFNHTDFSCTHPCISEDGNTMYFASNMLGGYGEFDIYMVRKTESGWGSPQNLGTKVNSFLNEGYPYLEGDFLYFSSEGHPGYGGMDIFKYNIRTEKIENLGKPINSSFDDFYFLKKGNEGYFVSNRDEETHQDEIFKYLLIE